MGDDQRIDLQIFHALRIEAQIQGKLYRKWQEYSAGVSSLLKALERYAPYKKDQFVLGLNEKVAKVEKIYEDRPYSLYQIHKVEARIPQPTDFRPVFEYQLRLVGGRVILTTPWDIETSLKLGDPILCNQKAMQDYRLATDKEVEDILGPLTINKKKRNPSQKKGY